MLDGNEWFRFFPTAKQAENDRDPEGINPTTAENQRQSFSILLTVPCTGTQSSTRRSWFHLLCIAIFTTHVQKLDGRGVKIQRSKTIWFPNVSLQLTARRTKFPSWTSVKERVRVLWNSKHKFSMHSLTCADSFLTTWPAFTYTNIFSPFMEFEG